MVPTRCRPLRSLSSRVVPLSRALSSIPVHSPRDGQLIGTLPDLSAAEVDDAVGAAAACARSSWSHRSSVESRAGSLRALASALRDQTERLASIESVDCGKPIAESRVDIGTCADLCEYYAEIAPTVLADGAALDVPDASFGARVVPYPAGVVAGVTPWNYPLMQAVCKVAPAIAAGCPMLLKPSPLASLTCIELGKLGAEEASLPLGALSVLTGGPPDGVADGAARLLSHPRVDYLSFTGSTRGGREMLGASAPLTRRTGLELGGKGAMICFEDADVPSVLDWAMLGIFVTAGQICSATSRLLVHESIAPSLLERLRDASCAIRMGDPLLEETQMGALISQGAAERVRSEIERAQHDGSKLLCGGAEPPALGKGVGGANLDGGYYVSPTILVDVPLESAAWREEIFGPVLCVRTFASEEEAIALVNDSPYGLGHAVMSADEERCERVAGALEAGTVWINCNQAIWPQTPFGGWKASGFGVEWGEAGMHEYLRHKTITKAAAGHSWDYYGAAHSTE